jgi:protein gp37
MGVETKIPWCHHTFNAWIGCAKVSAECKSCYAEVDTFSRVSRARGLELWGVDAARHVTSDANWHKPIVWDRAARDAGERRRVFCSSLSDVGEERIDLVAAHHRLSLLIEQTIGLDWLLLTKRPESLLDVFPRWRAQCPPNVWIGVTGGTQASFDARVAKLLEIRAIVRFVSIEPMLEEINVRPWLERGDPKRTYAGGRLLDWLIVGGESGPNARRFDVRWARSILYDCQSHRVPFFMKQVGARPGESNPGSERPYDAWDPISYRNMKDPKGGDPVEWPSELRVRQFPGDDLRPPWER